MRLYSPNNILKHKVLYNFAIQFHVSYWQYSISSLLTCAHHLGIPCLDKEQLLPKMCVTRQTISKVYFSLYT